MPRREAYSVMEDMYFLWSLVLLSKKKKDFCYCVSAISFFRVPSLRTFAQSITSVTSIG